MKKSPVFPSSNGISKNEGFTKKWNGQEMKAKDKPKSYYYENVCCDNLYNDKDTDQTSHYTLSMNYCHKLITSWYQSYEGNNNYLL